MVFERHTFYRNLKVMPNSSRELGKAAAILLPHCFLQVQLPEAS
jgi:hypothetical protein